MSKTICCFIRFDVLILFVCFLIADSWDLAIHLQIDFCLLRIGKTVEYFLFKLIASLDAIAVNSLKFVS